MPEASETVVIRPMVEADMSELVRLTAELVAFERGTDYCITEADFLRMGFGPNPEFGAFVADRGDGRLAGTAVHYQIPFVHTMRPLLMMKWLYVDPQFRGGGVGRKLMQRMARHAHETGHEKFCWFVLKDNERARTFYRGVGATPDPDWDRWVMPAESLASLAASEGS